jgi:hypothetical protein
LLNYHIFVVYLANVFLLAVREETSYNVIFCFKVALSENLAV